MKSITLFILLSIISLNCVAGKTNSEPVENNKIDEHQLDNRYTLGLMYIDYSSPKNVVKYEGISGGLVILKISKHSNAFKLGFKSGWVLLRIDNQPLDTNGIQTLRSRVQDLEKPNVLKLSIYNGKEYKELELERQTFGAINIEQDGGGFIVVQ